MLWLALAGCGGDGARFDIAVPGLSAGDGCSPPPRITGFVIDVGLPQTGDNECFKGFCAGGDDTFECVEGLETSPIEPGSRVTVRVGFYEDASSLRACATGTSTSIDDGDRIALSLSCRDLGGSPCRASIPMDASCPNVPGQ